jgi:4-aminobutyrate aminotransferase-like enzyme
LSILAIPQLLAACLGKNWPKSQPVISKKTFYTLGGAAALAIIEVCEEDKLIDLSVALGKYLREALENIRERHPSVGNVCYIGMFSSIELGANRETKKPSLIH